MLRISFRNEPEGTAVKLEGKLSGPWVDELDRCWKENTGHCHGLVSLDLSDVTYIDAEGKKLLARMLDQGIYLEGTNLMTQYIVDEIIRSASRAGKNGG
jgi:ABC-type transporter Mla MlaB component